VLLSTNMVENKITLSHGSGLQATKKLIQKIFLKHLGNEILLSLQDSAIINVGKEKLAFTVDSYTVNPLFFPGSDIGKLAIYGTINDLAVMGAKPVFISLGFIIEEGLDIATLEKIAISIKEAKNRTKVEIVAGDTKVVEKGKCDRVYITSSGIGVQILDSFPSLNSIAPGDKVIINGPVGEHELAVLLARGEFKFQADIRSDCQPLWEVIEKLLQNCPGIKFMRDATRGGIGGILNEIVEGRNFGIQIYEDKIPVREEVKGMCDILGFDYLFLANEGKFIAIVEESQAQKVIEIMKDSGYPLASIIGEVRKEFSQKVKLHTIKGGDRILDFPYGSQFPRIC